MARKTRVRAPTLTLLAALSASLGGCDSDPGERAVQRDVYSGPNAFENCVADWGNEALCQQRLNDEEKKKLAANNPHAGSPGVFIFGPGYSGADRYVTHNGVTYTPSTQKATNTAKFNSSYRPTSFSAPRPAYSGTPSSRSGFGATGRGMSTGS